MRWAATIAATMFSVSAQAQTAYLEHGDVSRGLTLPPTAPSLIDEATATSVNPAALTYLGALNLFYVHERSNARDATNDGLFVGDTFFDNVGVGFSIEWLRGGPGKRRKTSWGLSLGSDALSIGAAYNTYASRADGDLDDINGFDVGIAGRPQRYFSYGLVVKNVDEPARGALEFVRQYNASVAVQPWERGPALAVDYLIAERSRFEDSRLAYTLQGRLLRGINLSAGLSHGLDGFDAVALQVGLSVDLAHLGAGYAIGTSNSGSAHVITARLSGDRYPSVADARGKVAMLDLDDVLAPSRAPVLSLIGFAGEDPFLRLVRMLDEASRDPELTALVVKFEGTGLGLGKAWELREAFARLRASGKKIYANVLDAGDAEYLVASAADRIFAVPQATLLIDGFSASPVLFGGAMQKLGVHWDVVRVGAYKNAPDQLTKTELSAEARETINAYLDAQSGAYVKAIADSRKLTTDRVRAAIDAGLKTPEEARAQGLIDELVTREQLEKRMSELVPGARIAEDYWAERQRNRRWGSPARIAVVPVVGNIASGKSREDPAGLSAIAGAETVIQGLKQAADDPSIAAIVLRIDSSGGDGLASDLMYRAVLEAKQKKPVVASMGDVAASGGYYVAMGADRIFAAPTTITGSIGVFIVKPAVKDLAEKLGVAQQTFVRGARANLSGFYDPWTLDERATAQRWVDHFYDAFITEVASSRKLDKARVDSIARGRVWSGTDAHARGLVDQLGSIFDAISDARTRAGIEWNEPLDLVLVAEPKGLLASAAGESGVLTRLIGPVRADRKNAGTQFLGDALTAFGFTANALAEPRPLALSEFTLGVH